MAFGYDPDSDLSPEAQGIRDAIMLQIIKGGKGGGGNGGGNGGGCLIPFLVIFGAAGGLMSGLLYGVVKLVSVFIV